MSVLKRNRKPSTVQFITNAFEIYYNISAKCKKMSKNARVQIGLPIKQHAEKAAELTMLINEIKTKQDGTGCTRYILIKYVIAKYKFMLSLLQEPIEMINVKEEEAALDGKGTLSINRKEIGGTPKQWVLLSEKIREEILLLTGLLSNEQKILAIIGL